MDCQEKLSEILKIYKRVSILANKNGCKTLRIRHKKSGNDLCLHILPKENFAYEFLKGIRQENLPIVYETFTLSDGMMVLEEYIDGLNVAQISESGRISKKGAVKIVKSICNALTVLHENRIVHRDIKPENIMVDNNGRVVLIDFNSSRTVSLKSKDTEILGTIGYASPEQMGLTQTDARTDIYALGILLNVLITGKHPSEEMSKGKFGKIINKCTAISPDDRYQTAEQLKKEL